MLALVDLDGLVYKAGFATQDTYYRLNHPDHGIKEFKDQTKTEILLNNPWITEEELTLESVVEAKPPETAINAAKWLLRNALEAVGATRHEGYLSSGSQTFRHKLATTAVYKGNRVTDKPVHYKLIRQYYKDKFDATIMVDVEADDALGIRQCELLEDGKKSVICSTDKDLMMIPGLHYNLDKRVFTTVEDPGTLTYDNGKLRGTGLLWFYAQMLMGDPVDNIKGIRGIGDFKAYNLLADVYKPLHVVREQYKKAFKDKAKDRFEENKQLLWILRKPRTEV